jgi:transcriptional regulator with XRE-family HTH domain
MRGKRHPISGRRKLQWQSRRCQEGMPANGRDSWADIDVGGCLRRLRESHNLTIRALAERSGLAINTLSLIENARSSPSVSTLQQLALALEVPITAFFEIKAPESNIAYIKANDRPRAVFDYGILEDLGAGSRIQAVEPFVVTLEPNADSGPQDIVHTGYEFVYCLEGQIAYTIEGHTYLLEPGDSLLFEAFLPHRWQNLSMAESRSILVLHPTDIHDNPTIRHFLTD